MEVESENGRGRKSLVVILSAVARGFLQGLSVRNQLTKVDNKLVWENRQCSCPCICWLNATAALSKCISPASPHPLLTSGSVLAPDDDVAIRAYSPEILLPSLFLKLWSVCLHAFKNWNCNRDDSANQPTTPRGNWRLEKYICSSLSWLF